jgi:hypothetical protein
MDNWRIGEIEGLGTFYTPFTRAEFVFVFLYGAWSSKHKSDGGPTKNCTKQASSELSLVLRSYILGILAESASNFVGMAELDFRVPSRQSDDVARELVAAHLSSVLPSKHFVRLKSGSKMSDRGTLIVISLHERSKAHNWWHRNFCLSKSES